jgi:hypothetical protein
MDREANKLEEILPMDGIMMLLRPFALIVLERSREVH